MSHRHAIPRLAATVATLLGASAAWAQVPPAQPPTLPPSATAPGQIAPGRAPGQVQPAAPGQVQRIAPAQAQPRVGGQASRMPEGQGQKGDLHGPIDSLSDIQDTLKMVFMAADQDHNGLISREEADDAAYHIVGGIFFATDADGDGKVTSNEAQAVRQKVLQNNPLLRFVVRRAQAADGQAAQGGNELVKTVVGLLDGNSDRALSATEVRQVVSTTMQTLYEMADKDRDGQMSPDEWNNAVEGVAWSAFETAFQMADSDRNNSLSQEEFVKSLDDPLKTAFSILDANQDGQLTTSELRRGGQVIGWRLRSIAIPQANNPPFGATGSAAGNGEPTSRSVLRPPLGEPNARPAERTDR